MLYTSYISRIDEIPRDSIKLIITRYPPNNFNLLKYNKIHIVSALAPSHELINWYNLTNKDNNSWKTYVSRFLVELTTRDDMSDAINKVVKLVNSNLDVFLICYEKNYLKCHRHILATYINNKFGILFKEF